MSTELDTTGRTNGAGQHFTLAGKEYVWVINDHGRLEAQPFDREGLRSALRDLAARVKDGVLIDEPGPDEGGVSE